MRGPSGKTAVELTPVKWIWCDGVDVVVTIGETVRVVFYVIDVSGGADPQSRVNVKLVLPVEGALDAINKLQASLRTAVLAGGLVKRIDDRMH